MTLFAIMKDSTRSLLFGVFVLAGKPLTAAEVIRLVGPLGVSATNAKSHLTRLVAEGALDGVRPHELPRERQHLAKLHAKCHNWSAMPFTNGGSKVRLKPAFTSVSGTHEHGA